MSKYHQFEYNHVTEADYNNALKHNVVHAKTDFGDDMESSDVKKALNNELHNLKEAFAHFAKVQKEVYSSETRIYSDSNLDNITYTEEYCKHEKKRILKMITDFSAHYHHKMTVKSNRGKKLDMSNATDEQKQVAAGKAEAAALRSVNLLSSEFVEYLKETMVSYRGHGKKDIMKVVNSGINGVGFMLKLVFFLQDKLGLKNTEDKKRTYVCITPAFEKLLNSRVSYGEYNEAVRNYDGDNQSAQNKSDLLKNGTTLREYLTQHHDEKQAGKEEKKKTSLFITGVDRKQYISTNTNMQIFNLFQIPVDVTDKDSYQTRDNVNILRAASMAIDNAKNEVVEDEKVESTRGKNTTTSSDTPSTPNTRRRLAAASAPQEFYTAQSDSKSPRVTASTASSKSQRGRQTASQKISTDSDDE